MPFTGTTYQEFVEWFETSALKQQVISWYEAKGLEYVERPSPGYERNDAGRYVNSDGEELFYWTGTLNDNEYRAGDYADYKTEADIKSAFEQDNMLQRTFDDWDTYWSYIQRRQDLIDQGVILDKWESAGELWANQVIRAISNRGGPNSLRISNIVIAEMERRNEIAGTAEEELRDEFGIQQFMYNNDGDQFRWNGSGWTLIEEAEDFGFGDVVEIAFYMAVGAVAGGAGAGGTISNALNLSGAVGSAVAGAVNGAIAQAATSIARGESVDLSLESILASAVTAGALESDTVQGILDNVPSTGIESVDEAIRAGVLNSASQLALSGEVDAETLAQEMLRAGFGDDFQEFMDQIEDVVNLDGSALEDFIKDLQEQFPDIDAGIIEDAIRDLTDALPTNEVEELLGSITDRTGQAWDDFTNYLEAEGYTIEDFDLFESVLESINQAIPKDLNDLKDLFESVIEGMFPFSQDCVAGKPNDEYGYGETGGWTGTSTRQTQEDASVTVVVGGPGSSSEGIDQYPGWMDCVNLRVLIGIPGLDVPLPPGLTDFSVADLRNAIVDAGDSLEDFLEDPSAWIDEKIKDIRDSITEPFEDENALQDYIGTILGGVLAGALYDQIKEELEEEVPDLFLPFAPEEEGNECEVEVDGEMTKGTVQGGQCIPLSDSDDDDDDSFNDEEQTPKDCGEDEYYNEATKRCEKLKQEPIWIDDGPTAEECLNENRTHVPGDEQTRTPSKCGGCAEGFEPVANGNGENVCQPIDEVQEQCKGNQIRNELGECDDPIELVEDGPCKTESGEDGIYDAEGNCVPTRQAPIVIETCDDPNAVNYGQEGECGPCRDGAEKDPSTGLCPKSPVDTVVEPERCNDPNALNYGEEGECQYASPIVDDRVCDDPNAVNYGEEGECGACLDGATKNPETGLCPEPYVGVPSFGLCPDGKTQMQDQEGTNCPGYGGGDDMPPPPATCDDPNATLEEDGSCGPCKQGFVKNAIGLCIADTVDNTCPNGARDYPLCSECEDGSRPSDHEGGDCFNPIVTPPPPEVEPPPEEPPPEEPPVVEPPVETPPVGGGGGGGGGGGRSGMLSSDVPDWARQQFTAVEYRAPTRAIDVLNNFINKEVRQSLVSNSTQKKGMFDV